MKKNTSHLALLLCVFGFLTISCSDNIEPIDPIGENGEETVNEETSTDDDSQPDDDTSEDSGDDTNEDDTNGEDSNNDNMDGENSNNDTNDGDDTNGDTDDNSDTEATVVGNWRLVNAMIEDGQATTTFNGVEVSFPFSSTSQDEDVDITFQENPNIIMGMGQYTNVIEFTILGQNFSEETSFDSPLTDGNWEMVNDSELVISGSAQANGTFTINELTADTLILQTDFEQTVPTNDLELDVTGVLVIALARN